MASCYGMVAVQTAPEMTKKEIEECLQTAALMLDDEFGGFLSQEGDNAFDQPRMLWEELGDLVAVRPSGSRWMTVCEPISENGFDGETGIDIAQIYSVAFDAPCISFSICDSEYLFVSFSDPQRDICSWYITANEETLAQTDASELLNNEFPPELLQLLPESMIFLGHRIWKQRYEFEEERLEALAELLHIAVIGLREDFSEKDWPHHDIWQFDFQNF